MNVLLLGGHGKIALRLIPLLLARSWSVTAVIRNPEHKPDILSLANNHPGKLSVLLSSLDEVRSDADAKRILDAANPDYVVWAAGAGGKGGPARTQAIDSDAAKHILAASFASARVSKILLISWIGSRRAQPSWMSDADWARIQDVFHRVLPAYAQAKLEADEYMTALAARRAKDVAAGKAKPLQAINLRPGTLTDEEATRKVDLGRTSRGYGTVSREDVAIVADLLLARGDTEGWVDLLAGEEDVEGAVERVARGGVDAVEGEDVEGMVRRFGL
ncbi:NAD(P)-binding protein [Aspergillus campestris IBT 28561]|uniref:NAD(P)-binding protein n=1 Tax=Aspergillus campestris (strain IBT 28561) TaxID=1392248 RepID=A0A2I1CYY8_ASPC2|nr:NAD(P)-binding protein [Aspergillus campestris IBT 28561]PKY02835.1 NAD(P)-binding protein [Aspergillus campestris IBT 28561]